jgi:hypothetical protein
MGLPIFYKNHPDTVLTSVINEMRESRKAVISFLAYSSFARNKAAQKLFAVPKFSQSALLIWRKNVPSRTT